MKMIDRRSRWNSTLKRMGRREEHVRELAAQDAADWYVANREGLDEAQERQFQEWLRKSPINVREYLTISVIGHDLHTLPTVDESIDELLAQARADDAPDDVEILPASQTLPGNRHRSTAWQWSLAATVVLGIAVGLLWSFAGTGWNPQQAVAHYQTRHGERSLQVLADHSILHLDGDTAVDVRLGQSGRNVEVLHGQAYFEVFHDPSRPFRVLAGRTAVQDIGTKFDVRLDGDATVVTVAEGRVRVAPVSLIDRLRAYATGGSAGGAVELTAGERLRVVPGQEAQPETADLARATDWVRGRIIFQRERLAEVAARFNDYGSIPIEIDSPALGNLVISGSFKADDTESFVAFLRGLDGVRVETTPTRIRVIRP
jgi:transmembrane sensor